MLVVSSSVRMVDGVHSHTTSTRPVVALGLEFVVRTTGLQERLIDTSTASDDTDGSTSVAGNGLLCAGRKTNAGLVVFGRVADDGSIVARGTSERTAITDVLLNVADDGTFRELGEREDVADREGSFLSTVNKGTGVETLGSDEGLAAELVAVGVAEDDAGERSTTAGIVDDLLDNTTDIAVALSKVEWAEASRVLVQAGVGLEDGMRTPLRTNNATHL